MSKSKNNGTNSGLIKTVQIALLSAIIIVMTFTPLGYLKTAGLEITFLTIPVIVGAIVLGPTAGAFLGGVFGITSFIQCFGMSAFGATLLSINGFFTFIVCVPTRILMGLFCGLIFKALSKVDKTKIVSFAVSSLCGALLNTLLFMSALVALFSRTQFIQDLMSQMAVKNLFAFVVAFVGVQGLIEAGVCFVVATAVAKALYVFNKKIKLY